MQTSCEGGAIDPILKELLRLVRKHSRYGVARGSSTQLGDVEQELTLRYVEAFATPDHPLVAKLQARPEGATSTVIRDAIDIGRREQRIRRRFVPSSKEESDGQALDAVENLPAESGCTPEDLIDHTRFLRKVLDGLGQLGPREVAAISLKSDGASAKEIGKELGVTEGYARRILSDSRRKLFEHASRVRRLAG